MIYPDERVAEVASLGPVKAAELLDRGRGGDLQALADWTVRAAYKRLLKMGATPQRALRELRDILPMIELKPKVTL